MVPVPLPVRPYLLLITVTIVASAFSLTAPRIVKDINVSISPVGSDPAPLRSIGEVTFFSAQTAAKGKELWKTDGSDSGTASCGTSFLVPSPDCRRISWLRRWSGID